MGLSTWYGKPVEEDGAITLIHHAVNNGVTFFDTSDAYGPHTNEKLVGKVLVQTGIERSQKPVLASFSFQVAKFRFILQEFHCLVSPRLQKVNIELVLFISASRVCLVRKSRLPPSSPSPR